MNSPGGCRGKAGAACALALAVFSTPLFSAVAADDLAWPPITSQARPWAWWWWHGSAVDETNIAHELQRFHEAGLGGVQITSIYGTKGAETRDIPYLSPRWLDMMGYSVDEAHRLGMGVDMSLGSGWCFGGPTVSAEDVNASVVVKTYQVFPGHEIDGNFDRDLTQALIAYSTTGVKLDLTPNIRRAGGVEWIAPAISTNPWTVYAITQKPSGQKVKRPAPGGEGPMLNPAYAQAMRDWLPWFDKALTNYSGSKPEAVFQDSYEYRTDWAPDFFDQFETLRGYKLQNELPALFGDAQDEHTARVKYDYRRTLSDIMAQQSEPVWIDWAHQHGFQTIYQAHGTPGNWLDLYGDADMPETEMFHDDRSILISKFASSAAHTQGHPLTGAETGTWLKEHFTETLADVKYLADDMFLAGINHIYYHGACYSPDDAPWPGWLFYASTEMNPRNPIWHDVGALNEYIARCQSILQSGKPDNDVLLYWPVADFWTDPKGMVQPMAVGKTEWFEGQPIGKAAHELWSQGYAFDYVSDAQLLKAKVVDKKIGMPGGDYKVIVVPECKYMPLETFDKLLNLVSNGAAIVFEKLPMDIPGADDSENQRMELTNRVSQIQSTLQVPVMFNAPEARIGKGYVVIAPDLFCRAMPDDDEHEMSEVHFSYTRRSFDGGRNYFIVNHGETNFDGWIRFARPAKSVVILDPMTGVAGVAASRESAANSLEVHLQLRAGESIILRALADKIAEGPAWAYWQTNGQPVEITGNWNVKFVSGGPTLPEDFQSSKLASWTTFPDTNAQAFGGTAKYEISFDAPAGIETNGQDARATTTAFALDLGDVRQSARVTVNGKDYGTLITPPFRVVVDNLKATGNVLDVEVTSVAANRIRDLDRRGVKWKIFKDINIVDVNYSPFNAANWPLTDCGLLGPVTLTAVRADRVVGQPGSRE
ncbi:MAG TPA: glycosyl hydrolase [Verrucomicrobiae bacterium]|nr:glycosyl hydrolase [Verrucomicrobiae bacterium]